MQSDYYSQTSLQGKEWDFPRHSARLKVGFDMKCQIVHRKTSHSITTVASAGRFKVSLGIFRHSIPVMCQRGINLRLLSRKFGATLGGSIQMDWTYATVPASEDSLVKLHTEKERRHHIENPKKPSNEYVNYLGEPGMYQLTPLS